MVELGSEVKKYRVGDMVGVGCIVGSCGSCLCCDSNKEQYCSRICWNFYVWTYIINLIIL